MPNCDFYAHGEDHELILTHVLDSHDCRVFECYSAFDAEIVEFTSISHVEQHYSIADWSAGRHHSIHLQIYVDAANGPLEFRRIQLNSRECGGATYRYSCDGWGLVQLYLESPCGQQLRPSHSNHNTEKRAMAWADTYPEFGSPDLWDWSVVTSFSRKLNYFIRKSAVDKVESRVVLPAASTYGRFANA